VSDADQGEIEVLKARVVALEHACRRLGDFAALAAHELLKPLIVTHACATRLVEGGLDDEARADAELVLMASSQGRILVETLLADAQVAESALRAEPVDLADVVRDCVRLLGPDLEARRLRVEVGELPVVVGDAALLTAVFRNLLANAIEHGGGRRREIRVFAEPFDGGWKLAVDSPGRPLAAADRHALFELASRGSRERRSRGAGLGLVLVRRIVERHGGEVGVMSPDNRTNRFFFTLPAASAGQAPPSRIR
jgi:signal transduction histidine kinase